jgi:hypothetical protein
MREKARVTNNLASLITSRREAGRLGKEVLPREVEDQDRRNLQKGGELGPASRQGVKAE